MKKSITFLLIATIPFFLFCQNEIDMYGNNSTNEKDIQKSNISLISKSINSLNVVNQIPSPISFPNSVAFDGQSLWIAGYNEFQLFKISMSDGSIIDSFPITLETPYGMTYDSNHFFVYDANLDIIQKIDSGGNLISTITPAIQQPSYCQGLAFVNNNILLNDAREYSISSLNKIIYELDLTGIIINQFSAIGNLPSGLAYDGQYIWSTDVELNLLYKIDPSTFSVLETWDAPGSIPTGLTFDGQYLWILDNGTDMLYQIDTGALSTTEYQLNNFVNISPNPANNLINIDLNLMFKDLQIWIFDLEGKIIQNMEFKNKSHLNIDLSNLQKGMYLIKINADGKSYTHKIIKE